jgi:hypothetical protein
MEDGRWKIEARRLQLYSRFESFHLRSSIFTRFVPVESVPLANQFTVTVPVMPA